MNDVVENGDIIKKANKHLIMRFKNYLTLFAKNVAV